MLTSVPKEEEEIPMVSLEVSTAETIIETGLKLFGTIKKLPSFTVALI